jgi:hypothetical protein
MKKFFFLNLLIILFFTACKKEISIKIVNPLNKKIIDQIVVIKSSDFDGINIEKLSAYDNNKEIPSQVINGACGKEKTFGFLVNLEPKQSKIIYLKENQNKKEFNRRVHAEISEKVGYKLINGVYTGGKFVSVKKTKTPFGHKDHNLYYKCEGPCWESEKIAYRFYLDQRNATDIFGKKTKEIVLPNVGHTYNKSGNEMYHEMADWGMDIFKVGNSLGIGSFAAYVNNNIEMVSETDSVICTIENDGPIYASVNTKYYGWQIGNNKINLESNLSIIAGSRLTKSENKVTSNGGLFCTGLVKHSGTELIKSDSNGEWNYIATWGKQTTIKNNLGIAVIFNKNSAGKLTEDKLNYIIPLKPKNGIIQYYFAACWEQEPDGIKTKKEFINYLNDEIKKLNYPVIISK